MSQVVAGVVFTCLAISIGFGLLSIARPELSTWPPPRTTPWPRPVLAINGGESAAGGSYDTLHRKVSLSGITSLTREMKKVPASNGSISPFQ